MNCHLHASDPSVAVRTYGDAAVSARGTQGGEVGANRPLFTSPLAASLSGLRGLLLGLTQPSSA